MYKHESKKTKTTSIWFGVSLVGTSEQQGFARRHCFEAAAALEEVVLETEEPSQAYWLGLLSK